MEQKSIKTKVFTKEKIFGDSSELPIDVDFTLPDYCPEINKILKCRAVPRISAKGVNGRNITVDGIVTVTVMYCGESGKVCSYQYQHPFQKIFECEFEISDSVLKSSIKCEYINCRAVTNRKIDIHGACSVKVSLYKSKGTEIVSDIDDIGLELLRGTAPATSPIGYCEKYLLIDEEIELNDNFDEITALVRYDAKAVIKDCRVLPGKAVVKGEMYITALLCLLEGELKQIHTAIPFSQILEIEGLDELCLTDPKVSIAFLDICLKSKESKDCAVLSLDSKLLISCESSCDNDMAVVLDAFSRKFETSIIKKEVCFDKIIKNINEAFSIKKNIEFKGAEVSSVIDMWCETKLGSYSVKEGSINISGSVTVNIIAKDMDGIPFLCEKTLDFEYDYPIEEAWNNIKFTPVISVNSSSYTLTGSSSAEIRIELCLRGSVYSSVLLPVITDIKTDNTKPIERKNRSAMTIYFAAGGEKLWDIAYRYNASINEIKQINDIKGDYIENDRMLLVPMG